MIRSAKLSLRTKLTAIPAVVGLGFLFLILGDRAISTGVRKRLHLVEDDYIPLIESGPRLEASFTKLKRSFQDAVSARDTDLLEEARSLRDGLLAELDGIAPFTDASKLAQAKRAVADYYDSADSVSRRLMAGETPPDLDMLLGEYQDAWGKHGEQVVDRHSDRTGRHGFENLADALEPGSGG